MATSRWINSIACGTARRPPRHWRPTVNYRNGGDDGARPREDAGSGQQASGSGGKPGPLDGLGSSLLQGMANSAFSYAVETGIQTGSSSGIFDTLLSGAGSPADMLSGLSGMLAGQLASMAGSMLLNSLWSVDNQYEHV